MDHINTDAIHYRELGNNILSTRLTTYMCVRSWSMKCVSCTWLEHVFLHDYGNLLIYIYYKHMIYTKYYDINLSFVACALV